MILRQARSLVVGSSSSGDPSQVPLAHASLKKRFGQSSASATVEHRSTEAHIRRARLVRLSCVLRLLLRAVPKVTTTYPIAPTTSTHHPADRAPRRFSLPSLTHTPSISPAHVLTTIHIAYRIIPPPYRERMSLAAAPKHRKIENGYNDLHAARNRCRQNQPMLRIKHRPPRG